jgi:general L-amino acid transport system permease protein
VAATSTSEDATRGHRPPFWRDVRVIRFALQAGFLLAGVGVLLWLYTNLSTNLSRLGIRQDFGFLDQSAGFTILGTDFRGTQTIREALLTGIGNVLRVAVLGIVIAMVLGLLVGVGRLSANWLVRRAASLYVEVLRNVPPLALIIFFYYAIITQLLPGIADALTPANVMVLSNRGVYVPWVEVDEGANLFLGALVVAVAVAVAVAWWRTRRFEATGEPHHRVLWFLGVAVAVATMAWLVLDRPTTLSVPSLDGRVVTGGAQLYPEYGALLASLALYTSAFIAEIVRGSIQAVPKGQNEAAEALALSWGARLRYVVLPQALRIATPATGNEFLNLSKNVSLGLFIAFADVLRVARQAIGNGQPAPQLVFLALLSYLAISVVIAQLTNVANRRLQLVER